MQSVELGHQLLGVGAGAVVEGERHLVALRAAASDRRRVGQNRVDRSLLSLGGVRRTFGLIGCHDGRMSFVQMVGWIGIFV